MDDPWTGKQILGGTFLLLVAMGAVLMFWPLFVVLGIVAAIFWSINQRIERKATADRRGLAVRTFVLDGQRPQDRRVTVYEHAITCYGIDFPLPADIDASRLRFQSHEQVAEFLRQLRGADPGMQRVHERWR